MKLNTVSSMGVLVLTRLNVLDLVAECINHDDFIDEVDFFISQLET